MTRNSLRKAIAFQLYKLADWIEPKQQMIITLDQAQRQQDVVEIVAANPALFTN